MKDNSIKILSQEAVALKEALEGLGFFVLYFNNLTAQSIISLLQSFQKNVDHSQLSMFALAFLSSKETSSMLYDANNEDLSYEKIFSFFLEHSSNDSLSLAEIPKMIIFDLAYDKNEDIVLPRCPPNSLVLAARNTNLTFSLTIKTFVNKISYKKVQNIFEEIKNELGSSCFFVDETHDDVFIKQSINEM